MSSIKDRTLMVMRSLSAKTHIFTLCVIACTFFISACFFKEPNTDFARTTTSVTVDMEKVSSSNLEIVCEIKTLSIASDEETEPDLLVGTLEAEIEDDIIESLSISYDEYTELCKLVQAEATTEDEIGRQMVADVVINRVASPKFENTILDVINEPGQFEPVTNKVVDRMVPNHDTRVAVMNALTKDDITGGALYFQKDDYRIWGEKEYLYRYGGHSFYK